MIKLCWRGGSGGHTISAMLDYCTKEGGLDGFPIFETGNNLHTHRLAHNSIKTKFYEGQLHLYNDDFQYMFIDNKYPNDSETITQFDFSGEEIIAPIANNDLGRILIFSMSIGKTKNKKLPPDDHQIDYTNCRSDREKIEKIAFCLKNIMQTNFEEFHGHQYPKYAIDVLWFYYKEYEKIFNVIKECGWTPIESKLKSFCEQIIEFNKPYYSLLDNSIRVFNDVIHQTDKMYSLTLYETAIVHSLLLTHYNIENPSQVKLIPFPVTNTTDFFNLYDIT